MHHKLLSIATKQLLTRQYENIDHTRLSYESIGEDVFYQGLTTAVFQCQQVKVKWQLIPLASSQNIRKYDSFTSLDYEIANLKKINNELKGSDRFVIPVIEYIEKYQFKNSKENISSNDSSSGFNDENLWLFSGYTMPYINLGSVKDLLKKYSLTHTQKYHLLLAMATSLFKCHESGWIHGDVKPSNFLVAISANQNSNANGYKQPQVINTKTINPQTLNLASEFKTYLIDFSTSSYVRDDKKHIKNDFSYHDPNTEIIMNCQNQQHKMRTPAYVSPECWNGMPRSIQSDIYAFGVSMYEILMGCKPFKVNSIHETEFNKGLTSEQNKVKQWAKVHCQSPIPLLSKEWQHMQPMLNKLLAKKIENRICNLNEIILNLRYYINYL